MTLTVNQCNLLIGIVNASIKQASSSGIPIGKEYYNDIDEIKIKLYQELDEAIHKGNIR